MAPIVLFVYNRPSHTRQTLDALANNYSANMSDLYIYSDGPKSVGATCDVSMVRSIINEDKYVHLFNSVKIIQSKINKGLANSIIEGVSAVFQEYENVIVLEDDLVTSRSFLNYMNVSLKHFDGIENVGSITGYSPIFLQEINKDIYFVNRNCSYGWGTWRNVWLSIEWDSSKIKLSFIDYIKFKKFSGCGRDRIKRLINQKRGIIDSWSIRFGWSLSNLNLLTVYPTQALLRNIGWDGSGTHNKGASKAGEIFNTHVQDYKEN